MAQRQASPSWRDRLQGVLGKRWMTLLYVAVGCTITAIMVGLTAANVGALQASNFTTLEGLFQFRLNHGVAVKKAPIVLVGFDETTMTAIGEAGGSVPTRDFQAQLVQKLTADGAKVIGFDLTFLVSKPQDAAFSKALHNSGRSVLQYEWVSGGDLSSAGAQTQEPPPPLLAKAAAALGYNNVTDPDEDQVYRRATMVYTDLHGTQFLSWPAAVAKEYLGDLPTDLLHRNTFMVNFVDRPGYDFPLIPYQYFFVTGAGQPPPDPSLVRGKIVLIGSTSALQHDFLSTPLAAGDRFGVDYMANAVNTIVNDNPIIPVDPISQDLIVLIMGIVVTFTAIRLSIRMGTVLSTIYFLAWVVFVYYIFLYHDTWLNITAPALTIPAVYLSILAVRYFTEEREKQRIRNIFSHYVAPQVVRRLVEQGITLAPQRKEITVLFSDIRGFTTLSESLDPQQVVWFLDQYFERMADIVFRYGGTLDKYVGDAVMALWNAPDDVVDGPIKACQAALEMQQAVEDLRPVFKTISDYHLAIGIGINAGYAVVGTLGAGRKREYTAIGDTVNVASRLEGLNKQFGTDICISGEMADYLPEDADIREQGEVTVKGRSEPVKVFSLHALHGATSHAVPRSQTGPAPTVIATA